MKYILIAFGDFLIIKILFLFKEKLKTFVESNFDNKEIDINMDNFIKLFRNNPEVRKLLFGRHNLKAKSIFEEILSKSNSKQFFWEENFADVLIYIWNEFQLWEIPEIWTMVSLATKTCNFG